LGSGTRVESIDQYRGFAIISMIMVNFLGYFAKTPSWLRHADGIGITFADIVAPMFLFILGLLFRKSFLKRIDNSGKQKAYIHAIQRYVILIIIGLVGGAIGKMKIAFDWGILQSIGLAGLISLPFIELRNTYRLLIGFLLLAIFWICIPVNVINNVIAISEHGGPLGTISWASLILFSTFVGDIFNPRELDKSTRDILIFSLLSGVVGLLMSLVVPINKSLVSPSYILLSLGLSSLMFVVFMVIIDKFCISIPTLGVLGRNALVIFLLHYVLVKIGHLVLSGNAEFIVVIAGAVVIYLICFLLAYFLNSKNVYLKI